MPSRKVRLRASLPNMTRRAWLGGNTPASRDRNPCCFNSLLRLPLWFPQKIVCRQIRGQFYCLAPGSVPLSCVWRGIRTGERTPRQPGPRASRAELRASARAANDREPRSPLRAGAGSISHSMNKPTERRAGGGSPGRGALERNGPNLLADYLYLWETRSGIASR